MSGHGVYKGDRDLIFFFIVLLDANIKLIHTAPLQILTFVKKCPALVMGWADWWFKPISWLPWSKLNWIGLRRKSFMTIPQLQNGQHLFQYLKNRDSSRLMGKQLTFSSFDDSIPFLIFFFSGFHFWLVSDEGMTN